MKQEYLSIYPVEIKLKGEEIVTSFMMLVGMLSIDEQLNCLYLQYSLFNNQVSKSYLASEEMTEAILGNEPLEIEVARAFIYIARSEDDGYGLVPNLYIHDEKNRGLGIGTYLMSVMIHSAQDILEEVVPEVGRLQIELTDNSADSWTSRRVKELDVDSEEGTKGTKPSFKFTMLQ